MNKFWKAVSVAVATLAFAGSAQAGEPGRTLKPIYQPGHSASSSHSQSYASSSGSAYSHAYASSGPNAADVRNQYELNRLASIPPSQQRVIYTQPSSPVQHYQPAPTYRPAPNNCNVQGGYPCGHTGPVYHPAPQPPAQQPCPQYPQPGTVCHGGPNFHPGYPPVFLDVKPCGDKIIKRISDTRDGQRRYSVCYADLNHLAPPDRNRILLDRMNDAAKKACRDASSVLYSLRAKKDCQEDTLEAAVFEANLPGLVDTYFAVTGKRHPTVRVGDPIYY